MLSHVRGVSVFSGVLSLVVLLTGCDGGTRQGAGRADRTKLNAVGEALDASATNWACVRDNTQKLIWEVRTKDDGLRDWNKTYSNYSADYNAVNQLGADTDASGYVAAVNAAGLCGAKNWRLPSKDELQSLLAGTSPADYFPDAKLNGHKFLWSSIPDETKPNYVWAVNVEDGTASSVLRFSPGISVRLVRSVP